MIDFQENERRAKQAREASEAFFRWWDEACWNDEAEDPEVCRGRDLAKLAEVVKEALDAEWIARAVYDGY